jgi:hypothetical protein
MYKIRPGLSGGLQIEGILGIRKAQTSAISPASTEIPAGLIDLTKYQGLKPPNFYVVDLQLDNSKGALRPGMVGNGRVFGRRRSLAGLAFESVVNFWGRRFW